jgi:2-oxoisovalerate dehydrogenase E1 component
MSDSGTATTPQADRSEGTAAKKGRADVLSALGPEQLKLAYRVAVRSRVVEEHIVRLVSRGEVKFAIWGPGEEVHGAATALALHEVVDPQHFALVPHYRSGCLCSTWCTLNGFDDFSLYLLRQQYSRDTDAMSRGRQMVQHLHLPEYGILPVQSPVGMQLSKAAGYALGNKLKGITDAVAMAVVGDGTTAEGDLHEAMNAASVWQLPMIILITDNGIAISTPPEDGRGIRDFGAYAEGFGIAHFEADGRGFEDVYATTVAAATYVKEQQRPCVLYVHSLPRFNGHSSAADVTFDLGQEDPLIGFGSQLVEKGILEEEDVLRRIEGKGRDFFAHHDLGRVMTEEDTVARALLEQVRKEPEPPPESIFEHIYGPFPTVEETPPGEGTTHVTYAGAIRSALDKLISRKNGYLLGQDVARLGGVMQASAGLLARHPDRVADTPLNEPLIVGVSFGLGLYGDVMALPEIQFGDYSLNTLHWLVHLGNLRWATVGNAFTKVLLRMPTDPFGGGAMYHSMSMDGFYTPIPGLVIVMPSTSFDVHGLMLAAGEYDGPVVCLEPKWMYRQTRGPAFPGEPTDAKALQALKKRIMRGEVPDLPDVVVPFGKGVVRRTGRDVTVVAWGRAVWTALDAAAKLAQQGISAEVIDLRTLVPPDMDLVLGSVGRTGRLLVAAEDRSFGGFVRQIQGAVVEALPGTPTRALGQKNVPAIAQSPLLEDATILTAADVVAAALELVDTRTGGTGGWDWIPSRYFIG